MSKFKKILIYEAILILLFFLTYCNEIKKEKTSSSKNDQEYTLGNAYLDVNGSEEAKVHFEKGLLLLHSFEYWDAADEFIEAQTLDSNLVMAYWGEAMTYNHGLWRGQDYEKGVSALSKLGENREVRIAKASSALEKDLMESVEILYGEGTKFERDQAYSNHLGELYGKYPDNHEVAAFYALSLLGTVNEGRDEVVFEKGAKVAQGILEENPNHPGALHYLIHSYDDPYHAFKALEAADSYAVVAEDAGHALHMPSHIYVALGMWDKVVSSNEASYQATIDRKEKKNLDNDARGYHAFHWLMYGYLQQGRFADARKQIMDMQLYSKELPSTRARDYMIAMTGTYLVETRDWSDTEVLNNEVDLGKLNISIRTVNAYIQGMGHYMNGETKELENTIEAIKEDRKLAIGRMESRTVAGCGGSWKYEFPNQSDINKAEVMQHELSAYLSRLNGDPETTEKYLKNAVKLEESISYSYGPPIIVKPSFELYGEWLLDQRRYDEAVVAFENSLERGPKRVLSLQGLEKAYELTGNAEKAQEISKLLLAIQKTAKT